MKNKNIIVETDDAGYVSSVFIAGKATEEELSRLPDSEYQDCYKYVNGEFIADEHRIKNKKTEKEAVLKRIELKKQIAQLKETLSDGDYKIIKCYEAQLVGEQMPYDVQKLHQERSDLRNQINSLENSI